MNYPINATLTRCTGALPLIVLDSRPFNGMEVRPAELQQMAQQLLALADMANKLPMGGKHWKPTKVQMGVADAAKDQSGAAQLERQFSDAFHDVFTNMFVRSGVKKNG